jgi:hypothetical protein
LGYFLIVLTASAEDLRCSEADSWGWIGLAVGLAGKENSW